VNRRDRLLRQVHLQRFVVTLTNGETFDGLLADADDNSVKLVGAFAIDEKSRESVDGDLYLPRTQIRYMQTPEGRP
jgi:hypothetical protein